MYTVIIADDEEIERKALGLLIQKEFPNIKVLKYAENGVEFITCTQQLEPDFAIVDVNMPGMNGIDSIDLLRSKNIKTKFIVNTAYDDFEYIQKALSLKVDAYILKPTKRISIIATINTVCNSIDETRRNEKSQSQINALFSHIQPVMESEIMYSIFEQEPTQNSLDIWCEMHAQSFNGGVIITLIPADSIENFKLQNKNILRKKIHEVLDSRSNCLVSINESGIHILLFSFEISSDSNYKLWINDLLEVLLNFLQQSYNLLMQAGVGSFEKEFTKMGKSYKQSLKTLKAANSSVINFWDDVKLKKIDGEKEYEKFADEIVKALESGKVENIKNKLDEWNSYFLQDEYFANKIYIESKILILEEHSNTHLKSFYRLSEKIDDKSLALNKKDWLLNNLMEIMQIIEGKILLSNYVLAAIDIIESKYGEDLSLEIVAKTINISHFYLSRLLKSELNCTFIEYLTQVRIQEAVRLALTTKLSIKEITKRTGYANATYFCRVLKRTTGMTIGEIRENKGLK